MTVVWYLSNFGKFSAIIISKFLLLHCFFLFQYSSIHVLHFLKFPYKSWMPYFFFNVFCLCISLQEVLIDLSSIDSLVFPQPYSVTDEPIKNILHFHYNTLDIQPFLLLFLGISISLFTFPICSCLWLTFSIQFSSVTQSCSTLCGPMNSKMLGFPVHHQLLQFTQTHVH